MTQQTAPQRFDFGAWRDLARNDPQAFESQRRDAVDRLIARAPAHRQPRLRRLQWHIDQIRQRAGTPLAACVAISNLMWERINGEYSLYSALNEPDKVLARQRSRPANILPFQRN